MDIVPGGFVRSLLRVPVDGSDALDASLLSGADAVVLDLGEGASLSARDRVRAFLRAAQLEPHRPLLYLRLGSVEADTIDDDLVALMIGEPDGVVLGRSRSGMDVQRLGAKLAVQEAEYGLTEGETGILAEAGAAAEGLLAIGSYRGASPRLMGLAWDAPAFAADLGSADHRDADLSFTAPVMVARSWTLIGARAADVTAIDSLSPDLDPAAFRLECECARRDGFNAKMAATIEQVRIINAVFDRGG